MKTNDDQPLFAIERRERILRLLEERSKILVPELCEFFGVSPATIRGDLRDLEAAGRLKRTHGGAVPAGKTAFEANSSRKEIEHSGEKARIALKAAQFIEDGDTILLDTGTTTYELARLLAGRGNLTVVTNDFRIASALESESSVAVVVIGGTLRRGFHCATGPMALAALAEINVDKAFIAANAFSLEKGFTTPNFDHAEVKKRMISVASESIVLADSSKIGRISFVKFADIGTIDRFVTDDGIGAETAEAVKAGNPDLGLYVV